MRKLIIILTAVIIAATLISCAEKTAEYVNVTFDIEQLALKLSLDVAFDDELIRLKDDAVSLAYDFGGESTVVYAGSGATPEIIIITKCDDAATADAAVLKIKDYINNQIKLFTDYDASQLPKLESAFCSAYGSYAVCVVSGDNTAAQTIIEAAAQNA
jgi:hypothetical protein